MKKISIVFVVLILALSASVSFASNASMTADEVNASEAVMKLTGDVLITIEKSKEMVVNADNLVKKDKLLLLEGNVEIKSDNLVIHTEKAVILTINNTVKIKLDSCELSNT